MRWRLGEERPSPKGVLRQQRAEDVQPCRDSCTHITRVSPVQLLTDRKYCERG